MTRLTIDEELALMDELIRDLDAPVGTPEGYMREHLMAARSYLLGSMPEEYQMTLELAKETLPEIEQPQLRSRIDDFLRQATVDVARV
jgi:predicted metal-dependent hydrolase